MGTGAVADPRDIAVERAKQVFRFLRAFAERNVPVRRQLSEHHWTQLLRQLPKHPSISVGEVQLTSTDSAAATDGVSNEALITVRRPKTTQAPEPPDVILDFLQQGWRDPEKVIEVLEVRNVIRAGQTVSERFDAEERRVQALQKWLATWNVWAEAERPARNAMRVFERLYELKGRIDRESERVELMLGDGRLRWSNALGVVDHPVLLQRVELVFDSDAPEFRIVDTDREPELYGAALQGGAALLSQQLNALRTELEKGGYHPLAREGTTGFLKRLVQVLAPNGVFAESDGDRTTTGAQPVITRDPVLFLRDRSSGFPAAFDRVLQDLEVRGEVPVSLTRLVGVEPAISDEREIGEWSPWGEPPDILLSKPANEEQIHIARALDRHKAVLVQGPPGTGKSHTIANLIGHLVANGKRVLVTSHTTKALRVLRGHVVDSLRPLCVALLENDLEGRTQMEEAVKGILARLTTSTSATLEQQVAQLAGVRAALNGDLARIARELRTAREAEYAPIVIAGESILPSQAARWTKDMQKGNDWIPRPVQAGAPVPLGREEMADLYASNAQISVDEEREIAAGLPSLEALPSAPLFSSWVAALDAREPPEMAAFWERPGLEVELPVLTRFLDCVHTMASEFQRMEAWQLKLVGAGHSSGADQELWRQLGRMAVEADERLSNARPDFIEHDPQLPNGMSVDDALKTCREIEAHVDKGGSLGRMGLLFHGAWKTFLLDAQCNGREPKTIAEIRALAVRATVEAGRVTLRVRWIRQAEPAGLPRWHSLGIDPEAKLKEYAGLFEALLTWWSRRWSIAEAEAVEAGFRWPQFRSWHVARSVPRSPFEQDGALLAGPLPETIEWRIRVARRSTAIQLLAELETTLQPFPGLTCRELLGMVRRRDVRGFASSLAKLQRVISKTSLNNRRQALLASLSPAAPEWSKAIHRRDYPHGDERVPGDLVVAWRYRQLRQEVDRRAALDEVVLSQQLHQRRNELREATANLIDRRAWLGQIRRINLQARQALQGWAQTQKRIGKGTGKRVPELQAEARKLLDQARDAVPVWIMPLARVAESFDATKGKFDVVIVDEASQSDVTGLLAWYLGERVVIVGDHEQVSPLAVGQQIVMMTQLIAEHLTGVPNSHLYDGTLSIYDLARQSFGGTIALREHFRCVPDIIDFSNYLSYNGDIRPLRDPTRVPRPHVVEHVVSGVTKGSDKRNVKEAQILVAIMQALCELPENQGRTIGAISLVGDEQAGFILELAQQVLGAVELERRRFAAGNAAQFQGDERDIVLLSMVDAPPLAGTLTLRADDVFKQRYNVAASRARDQLWLIHSLEPNNHLKTTDLRRRLIEHVRAPSARRGAIQKAQERSESPFELSVLQRLGSASYRIESQVWVGQHRIDIVVSDDNGQVALECDGDRYHGVDQIPEDMARQAVLERAGWRFIRVRGTRYYRAQEETMTWVFAELARLGVQPTSQASEAGLSGSVGSEFRDNVVRRAWEIMRDKGWTEPVEAGPVEPVNRD